jgi:hypothetical protein
MSVQQVTSGYRLKAFVLILIFKTMPKEKVSLVKECSTAIGHTTLMLARNLDAVSPQEYKFNRFNAVFLASHAN